MKMCVLDFNTQKIITQVKINHLYYEECHGISSDNQLQYPPHIWKSCILQDIQITFSYCTLINF